MPTPTHMQQDLLQGQQATSTKTFDNGRLTDLDFSLLQDSGWYDVKYGSAGFAPLGYHAGCSWVLGQADAVRENATTKGLLCDPDVTLACSVQECLTPLSAYPFTSSVPYKACLNARPKKCSACLADYSGLGMCYDNTLDSGTVFPRPVRPLWSLALPKAQCAAVPLPSCTSLTSLVLERLRRELRARPSLCHPS
jgi:hypothetical protein